MLRRVEATAEKRFGSLRHMVLTAAAGAGAGTLSLAEFTSAVSPEVNEREARAVFARLGAGGSPVPGQEPRLDYAELLALIRPRALVCVRVRLVCMLFDGFFS